MSSNDNENDPVHWYQWEILHRQPYSQEYLGTVAETWLRDYDSITVGRAPLSPEGCSFKHVPSQSDKYGGDTGIKYKDLF